MLSQRSPLWLCKRPFMLLLASLLLTLAPHSLSFGEQNEAESVKATATTPPSKPPTSNRFSFRDNLFKLSFVDGNLIVNKRGSEDHTIAWKKPGKVIALHLFRWQGRLAAVLKLRREMDYEFRIISFDQDVQAIKSNQAIYQTSDGRFQILSAIGDANGLVVPSDMIVVTLIAEDKGHVCDAVIFRQGCTQAGDDLSLGTAVHLKADLK